MALNYCVAVGCACGTVSGQCRTWNQVFPANSPAARVAHAMAFDSRDDPLAGTVLFGGSNSQGTYYGDTWVYDGSNWNLRDGSGPSPREYHAMVFDEARNRVVLFGGSFNTTKYGDTWEWDGNEWTLRATTGPSARNLHAMAYDSRRQRTVLFGGLATTGRASDTWEWDGTSWTQAFPASIPPARAYHTMAFDAGCRAVTVAGGQTDFGTDDDLWEYDGINWRPGFPEATFEPRLVPSMVYDTVARRLVLVGGYAGFAAVVGTWEYEGFEWRLVSSAGASNRFLGAAVFDSQRGRTVHFGGFIGDTTTISNQTWEWFPSGQPVAVTSQPTNQSVLSNQTAVFSVTATGTGTISYQWRRNGVNLTNTGAYSGANGPTLTISGAVQGLEGAYDCRLSNACGAVLSSPAALRVNCPGDGDYSGIVDFADVTAAFANWLVTCP